jgi:hypothetical protein
MYPRRNLSLSYFVVLALVISACTNADDASDIETVDESRTSALESTTNIEDVTTTTAKPNTTGEPTSVPEGARDDQPVTEDGPETTATTSPTTSGPTTTAAPTTASPTTTKAPPDAGGGGGTPKVDPFDMYTGILGFFSPDKLVTPAVAPSPVAAPGTFPLTGLAGSSSNRPAVVVKIDNGSKALPQQGLNAADIVIEEEVEWGITRLAAIFHSNQSEVGPVRSGRSTDISFLNSLGNPALVYSGANDVIDALLLNQKNVQNFSAARSNAYWRKSGRPAPSNLWANTTSFTDAASGGAPPAQFHFRGAGEPAPVGTATSNISISYPSRSVSWSWTGSAWARTQDGKAHQTNGGQVTAANVIVIEARVVATGLVDSVGGIVPEVVWLGNGHAAVFTDGRRINATWTRSTLRSPSTLTDADGNVIELTPGRTWVELTAPGNSSSS